MIFGKYINRYYLKNAPVLLLGLLALLMVDYIQLLIPQFYRLVINGVNLGQVVVNGQTLPFTKEVLLQHICLPMIWIVVLMVIGRFLWRICFFGSAVRVAANLRERMFDHSRQLSQQYYQVNKVGNLMSLYTNDIDTIQECFGDGILMFFDALVLGLMALYKMWRMDYKLTLLALIPALIMFGIGTVMGTAMTKRWEERQQAFSDLSDFAQENFSGIAVIKAFVKELKELMAFRKLNKQNEEINVIYTKIATLLEVLVTLFVESVICVILGYGGYLVYQGRFNAGQLVEYAEGEKIFTEPKHPYTQGLQAAIPRLDEEKDTLLSIPGNVPMLYELPKGCIFSPRCAHATEQCRNERPELVKNSGHLVRCFLYEDNKKQTESQSKGGAQA